MHKSQGLGLPYMECSLDDVFEAGAAYVAISRAITLEGLRVTSYRADRIRVSPRVVEFYEGKVRGWVGG